ncbi:MAG: response regulator [Ferruginibacter sp.]
MSPVDSPINSWHVLLADDDKDDCLLFKDALDELPLSVHFTVLHNGEMLMQLLNDNKEERPDILFLDLNMPRKNGFQCLSEIKQHEELKGLAVVILSTYFDQVVIDQLYEQGAQYCVRKPNEFSKLKKAIEQALNQTMAARSVDGAGSFIQPPKKDFVL